MKRIAEDLPSEGGHGGMGMSDSDMGMDMDPAELEKAKPFDRAFIDAMVTHHKGAIAMAKDELAKGKHAELREMANDIIGAQTEEMARMREWHEAWYGSEDPMADDDMNMGN